jgi:hypothetical protein
MMLYDEKLHALNIAALNAKWDAADKKNEARHPSQAEWREYVIATTKAKAAGKKLPYDAVPDDKWEPVKYAGVCSLAKAA